MAFKQRDKAKTRPLEFSRNPFRFIRGFAFPRLRKLPVDNKTQSDLFHRRWSKTSWIKALRKLACRRWTRNTTRQHTGGWSKRINVQTASARCMKTWLNSSNWKRSPKRTKKCIQIFSHKLNGFRIETSSKKACNFWRLKIKPMSKGSTRTWSRLS